MSCVSVQLVFALFPAIHACSTLHFPVPRRRLSLFPELLCPTLQVVLCECICNNCFVFYCLLIMFHSFMLQEIKFILVKVIPNLCEQLRSINIFLPIVCLILQADIVYIPYCWWHGFRVYDPLVLLCGRVYILILVIRLIVAV